MPTIAPLLSPPQSQEQLLAQAQQLAGYSLGELAQLAGIPIPLDLKRDKGWIGILLEIWLGASAGSKYAVGNDMNSMMAGTYPGPGITLGPALTFGYLSASHMAQQHAL